MSIARLLAFCLLAVASFGCHNGDREYNISGGSQAVCGAFCDRLYECGSLGPGQYSACISHCGARVADDEEGTIEGCACVADDVCRSESEYDCPGAPFPPGMSEGQGGSAGRGPGGGAAGGHSQAGQPGGGQSGQAGQGAGYACGVDNDCASNEDCLGGVCRSRCHASCQCHAGEVCSDGHCGAPLEPVLSCQTDCDCAAGRACVEGACQ